MISVLSGAVEGDNDNNDKDTKLQEGEEGALAFFEKNLGNHFDTVKEVNQPATAKHLHQPPLARIWACILILSKKVINLGRLLQAV